MFIVQINGNDGILKELVSLRTDRNLAEADFLSTCKTEMSDWDAYGKEDIDNFLDEGYAQTGAGVVMLIDTSNCVSDDQIRCTLTRQPGEHVTVAEVIEEGELSLKPGMTLDQVLEGCSGNLDSACSWEIQGQILFKGSDGKWYTITTESIIGEANPAFVETVLEDAKDAAK